VEKEMKVPSLTDLTPHEFKCEGALTCPAVLCDRKADDFYVIGALVDHRGTDYAGRVGENEVLVKLPANLVRLAVLDELRAKITA
jgi:hypothetical protein